jgi:hypothetical protein
MKYSLRSLMIVVILAPPLLAGAWYAWQLFADREPIQLPPPRNQVIIPNPVPPLPPTSSATEPKLPKP